MQFGWIPNRGTPAFVLSNIHEVGVVCLGTTAQMIDFRIADLRALAFHRVAFLKYSFLEASNSCKGLRIGERRTGYQSYSNIGWGGALH